MSINLGELRKDQTLARGAEAEVFTGTYLGFDVVAKHRFAKKYRAEQIDSLLRKNRSIQEVRLLINAKKLGIMVPYVLDLDKSDWIIVLERIFGNPLKEHMQDKNLEQYFITIGEYLGILHTNNIVHGDLTTSNILLADEQIWFIDFGLGYVTTQIEDYAVDILVLKHTLISSHNSQYEFAYKAFFQGYKSTNTEYASVIKRISKVESRIRYH